MKTHTSNFKNAIKTFGRELDSKITYTNNGTQVELGAEQLNSVSPHYEGGILKSVMKQLDIDSNVEIPLETILTYQLGVKVGNSYEYINFGNYVVYKAEKQEDTNSWQITCYDKMLYAMKDYEALNITYPITIRNYITAICNKIGLTFKYSSSGTFANYNKTITSELYLDKDGNSLGYTYRDVLDELAQVTASTICINENDDELEVRYINNTNDTIDEEFLKDVNVNFGEKFGPVNTIVLSRSAGADNIYYPSTLPSNPIEIKISDNQILNGDNRDEFIANIYNKLNGLEFYINDFSSTGITYYNLCDRYNVQIGDNTYSCVMFNDEINVTQGLEENVYTDMPEESVTDYTKADKTDRKINQTTLIVDKQQSEIIALVDTTEDIQKEINPTNTASGSSIYLEDSTDADLVNFELEGKTTQATRSGKNLYNYKDTNSVNQLYTTDDDGWISATYDNTGSSAVFLNYYTNNLNLNYSTNYAIITEIKSVSGTGTFQLTSTASSYGQFASSASYSLANLSAGDIKKNIVTTKASGETITDGLRTYLRFASGQSGSITFRISVLADTTVSINNFEYEAYGVMPSPNYPSELVSVGYTNLFDVTSFESNLVSGKILNDNGVETSDSNSTYSTYKIPIKANQTYSIKGYFQRVYLLNSSGTFVSRILYNSSTTDPMNTTYTPTIDGYFEFQIKNATYNSNKGQEFVYKGIINHEYIPYGKYGIEVKTTGKNLIPFTNQDFTVNNIRYYVNNGSLFLNGTSTGETSSKNANFKNNFNFTLPAGTYTISHKTGIIAVYLYKYNSDSSSFITLSTNATSSSFTLAEETKLYIGFYVYQNSFSNDTVEIMIEKGSSKTTYEQHKSNTHLYTLNQPLRSIGDTKDLLYIKNGMLYVERKIGSIVLNGSESYTLYNSTNARTIFTTTISQTMDNYSTSSQIPNLKSSHFISVSQGATWTTGNISRRTQAQNNIYLTMANGYTVSTFKAWLQNNNVEVQYILKEPNTEGLGKIEVPITYKTITNINTNDELEPNMNITYVMDTQITNYVQNQVSQIKITEDGILAEVNRKVDNEEIIAKLNLAIEDEQGIIEITGNQVTIDSDYFKLNADGTIKSTGGTIGGYKITDNMLYAETFARYNYTQRDLNKIRNYLMETGTLTPEEIEKYDINGDGIITSYDFLMVKFFIDYNVTPTSPAKIIMRTGNSISDNAYVIQDGAGNDIINLNFNGIYYKNTNLANTNTYLENELIVGKWIDDKPIYRKVIDIGNLPNASQTIVSHNISNIERIVKLYGSATRDSDKDTMPIPYVTFNSNNSGGINLFANNVSVLVSTSTDRSSYTGYVVLEYTKTSD